MTIDRGVFPFKIHVAVLRRQSPPNAERIYVTGWPADSIPDRDKECFSPTKRPHRLWNPFRLYLIGIGGSFLEYNAARDVKLTTYLLVPSLRTRGAIPSFPIRLHIVHRRKFAFTLPLLLNCDSVAYSGVYF